MEGRAYRNSPVGCFSEGASLAEGRVTRRSIRVESCYFSQKAVTSKTLTERSERHGVQGVWRTFCSHGTNFIASWRDRDTSLIGAANLSPVTELVAGTCTVSCRRP
jgi:hypothetical protein